MEETRLVKHLAHVLDHIGAHPIVFGRGNHAAVVLQPEIVAGGEIQLGDRLKSQTPQAIKLLSQLFGAPRALHRQFGMAWIKHLFGKIHQQKVAA